MTSSQSGRESIANQVRIGGALSLLATASIAGAGQPHVLRVDQTAPAGGNGESWAGAFRDIHDALNAARASFASDPSSPVEVRIAHGTYKPDKGTGDRSKYYDASVPVSMMTLSLVGAFAGLGGVDPDRRDFVATPTILSGDLAGNDTPNFGNRADNSRSLLRANMRSGWITIDGIQFHGADSEANGGYQAGPAVRLMSAPIPVYGDPSYIRVATLANCVVEENRVAQESGGAVWVQATSTEVRRSRLSANSATNGGGGAIYTWGGLALIECAFADNSSKYYGGAVQCDSSLSARSCLFAENRSQSGGALYIWNTGGGGQSLIDSCTIVRSEGRAVIIAGAGTIRNTAFWNNSGTSGRNIWVASNLRLLLQSCILQDGAASVQSWADSAVFQDCGETDPKFVRPAPSDANPADWREWNYRLRTDSPAAHFGKVPGSGGFADLDGNLPESLNPFTPIDIGCYYNNILGCLANLDRDAGSIVNDDDFVVFVGAYNLGISPPANPGADLNRDGLVNDGDFQLFAAAYDAMMCP